jgi:hypothetical protein
MARPNPCDPKKTAASAGAAATTSAHAASHPYCCGCGKQSVAVASPLSLSQTPAGALISATAPPCMALVELISSLQVAETAGVDDDAPSADAQFLVYRRDTNTYVPSSSQPEIRVFHSLARHDGSGAPIGAPPVTSGERAWIYFNAQSGRYELIERPPTATRFQLTGGLSTGGSATATSVAWDGTAWTTTSESLTVYDSMNSFAAPSGSLGVAIWCADSARWEVVQSDHGSCSPGSFTCFNVITGVSKVDTNLVFTRKQICLPAGATITDLLDISIECCADDGEPTEG